MTASPDDRVAIYIDLYDLYCGLRDEQMGDLRLDYFRLAKQLVGPRRLVAAYGFDSEPGEHADAKQRFHDHLSLTGFRVVTRPFHHEAAGGYDQVGFAMATELLAGCFRDHYDVAIVVSGDRRLVPVIERLGAEGKRVEVAALRRSLSREMRSASDLTHLIDHIPILELRAESEPWHQNDAEADPEREVVA